MILEALQLENFRNFASAELHFSSDRILFEGGNGQGKTSLLEAVYYLANLRSFRTMKVTEMKKLGMPYFKLGLTLLRSGGWKSRLEVTADEVRTLTVDKAPLSKASDFTGKIKTIAFLPDDPLIISGSSILRRRCFDMFISMMDRSYFLILQNYMQALRSRNFLLKSRRNDPDILNSYSAVLASAGTQIVQKRFEYVCIITKLMQKLFEELYPELSDFEVRMHYTRETGTLETYQQKIQKELRRDQLKGVTSFGPHLDDFDFLFDGKSMRSFGSRGQCRMASLILKLAELEAVRQTPDALKNTVVLVDDATADLDSKARASFEEKISSAGQSFFAFTEVPREYAAGNCERYLVQNGTVLPQNTE